MDQGTKEFTKVTLFLPIKEQAEDLNVTGDGFLRTDVLTKFVRKSELKTGG